MIDEQQNYINQYESFINGNIGLFKRWLNTLNGDEIYNFIKWLQSEGLKI